MEPDECYYIQNEPLIGSRTDIDFQTDPPPDLACEMDYTSHAIDRESIYAALAVPEIWLCNGTEVAGMLRNAAGEYERIETSSAFPFLKLSDVERFVKMRMTMRENEILYAFREWAIATHGKK